MSDAGKDGMAEVIKMQEIVNGLNCETRIFVASIRDVDSMAQLAAKGCAANGLEASPVMT